MSSPAKMVKKYLTYDSSGQSDDSASESSSQSYLPLRKSFIQFTILWDKDEKKLHVRITSLRSTFSKFAKIGDKVFLKIQLLKDKTLLQSMMNLFQRRSSDELKDIIVAERKSYTKKRKKEMVFEENYLFDLTEPSLGDYSLRLLLCTTDFTQEQGLDNVEKMGECITPLADLEQSKEYAIATVLKPVLKVRLIGCAC